jgi:hypothetical protein
VILRDFKHPGRKEYGDIDFLETGLFYWLWVQVISMIWPPELNFK